MRAVRLINSGQQPTLAEEDSARPMPGRNDLLIRVHAAGVTPTELLWRPTSYTRAGEKRDRGVPGHEFSGVIAAIGRDVTGFQVSQEVLERSWGVLKPHGRLVSVAAVNEDTADKRAKRAFFIVEPNQQQLAEIRNLFDAGHLQPVVDAVVPLAQAPLAYTGELGQRLGRGKVVVTVATELPGGGVH